jgi:Flp pilus assembly protein TadB
MNVRAAAWKAAPSRRLVLRPEVVAAWCDDLARRVRSGDTLAAALRHAATVDPALHVSTDDIRLALDRGSGVAEAVSGTHRRSKEGSVPGLQHLTLARSIIGVSATIGGSAAAPLDRVAAALRLRAVDRDDRATQAAQARMSAHVLTIVPLLMLLVLTAADADVRTAIVGGAGSVCVVLGLLLNACGWWWMRRLVEVPQ